MNGHLSRATTARIAAALIACAFACGAFADDDVGVLRTRELAAYRAECSGCHVAYPPGLLPAMSWQRLMADLPRHFGTDASVDTATGRMLGTWLAANAGSPRASNTAAAGDRITQTPWFLREHRKVPAGTWKRPAVRGAANCGACHAQADQGIFDEYDIRIPE